MDAYAPHRRFIALLVLIHGTSQFLPLAGSAYLDLLQRGGSPLSLIHFGQWLVSLVSWLRPSLPFLLVMWAAFGSGHVLFRLGRSLFVLTTVMLAEGIALLIARNSQGEKSGYMLQLNALVFAGALIAFFCCGYLAKWRVVLADAGSVSDLEMNRALSLRNLFALVTMAAIALFLGRTLAGQFSRLPGTWQLGYALAMGCAIAISLVPLIPLALNPTRARGWYIWTLVGFVSLVAAQIGVAFVVQKVISAASVWSVGSYAGVTFTGVAASLWLVRLAGYRLLVAENNTPIGATTLLLSRASGDGM